MKKSVLSLAAVLVLSSTTMFAAVSGTNPRPQAVSGTNPRPQVVDTPTEDTPTMMQMIMAYFGM